tara:strand:- start:261 stop:593 length:333 start_codon:yes stop_codon:yes gene_type:complete
MGTYLTGTYSVIHDSTNADFDNFVYSAIYIVTASVALTINGTTFTPTVAGETIDIIVQEDGTTLNAAYLLLGNAKPVGLFRTGLVTTTGGTTGGEQWQFVNIKTGLPTNG